jgi:hypothetical protein
MYQFSNNLHVYEGWEKSDKFGPASTWYRDHPTIKRWLFGPNNLDTGEAQEFVENWKDFSDQAVPRCRILRDNAAPMLLSYDAYKQDDIGLALHYAERIHDDDWKEACIAWLTRRAKPIPAR